MNLTLDILSKKEYELYEDTISLKGTIEELTKLISNKGIFEKYAKIHKNYFELFILTSDDSIKLEVLKRLVFLNWYSMVEPSFYTGVDNLDDETVLNSYINLNDYINNNKLDSEFIWMLSYYASWDWTILTFSENKLDALTKFIKNVDNSILHVPKHQLPKGIMDNRGQMGIYWISCLVESI